MKTQAEIIKDMQAESQRRDRYNALHNEGAAGCYNPHEDRLAILGDELAAARKAQSPFALDLAGERAWFNAQNFAAADLAKANAACLARGYSLAELQAAAKAANAKKGSK